MTDLEKMSIIDLLREYRYAFHEHFEHNDKEFLREMNTYQDEILRRFRELEDKQIPF
jgi:uncharacterized membrane protein (DUF106 family)